MRDAPDMTAARIARRHVLSALTDVIAALDRRRPQDDRHSEDAISRDAALLRSAAVSRVEALEREERALGAPGDGGGARP